MIARKPIHLLTEEERKQVPKMKDLWLDIGASDNEDAQKAVRIGDAVTSRLGVPRASQRQGGRIGDGQQGRSVGGRRGPSPRDAGKLRCSVYAVSTVQEELGLRGPDRTFGIDPQVGVAVDVTHATDCPTIEKKEEGDIAAGQRTGDSRGPNMNPKVVERLFAAAEEQRHRVSTRRLGQGDRHRRQRHSDQSRRGGRRPDQHSQSLHAQSGRNDLVGRHRPGRRYLGSICRGLAPDADLTP